MAQQMVRRLVEASRFRARLFADDGSLVADSLLLGGPGGGVQIEELPPPRTEGQQLKDLLAGYDRLLARLWSRRICRSMSRTPVRRPGTIPKPCWRCPAKPATTVRAEPDGGMVLSVAVPVQRYKQVLAALMLTKGSAPSTPRC